MPLSCVPYTSKHGAPHSSSMLRAVLHAEVGADQAHAEALRIDAHLVARDQRHVAQVGRETEDHVDAPRLHDLDLAARRRGGAAARHHRHRARIAPQRLARRDAAVGEPQRIGHQHQVAGPHAVQREAAPAQDRHRLAVLRRVEHGPRQARRAAARLQHQRHARPVRGRDAHEVPERRIAFDALADVVHVVGRNFFEIVEPADVAGLDAGVAPVALKERDFPAAPHRLEEPALLQRAQLVARHAERGAEVIGRRRVVARELLEIERARVPGYRSGLHRDLT